jgi:hypothetical protein
MRVVYFFRRGCGVGLGLRMVALWIPFLGLGAAFIAFFAFLTFFAFFAKSASHVELSILALGSRASQPTRAVIPVF